GVGRFGLPLVVTAAGALVLWRRPRPDPVRLGVCLLIVLATSCGLLHLGRHGLAWGAPGAALARAGGDVGLVASEPLRGVLGPWGAGLVLGTVLAAALLIVARLTVREGLAHVGRGVRAVVRLVAELGRLSAEKDP